MAISSYNEFVSHVLGMLDAFGVLTPLKWLLLFGLSIAGFWAFIGVLRGGK